MSYKKNNFRAYKTPILQHSGFSKKGFGKNVVVLKRHEYKVRKERLSGDAPKDFILIYEYGNSRKSKTKTWTKYIAKVGHKWYPNESITEALISRLGQVWGFELAEHKLYVISEQIRFCSKYFLNRSENELVHGADILSRCLQEHDNKFIQEIDGKGLAQELISYQFIEDCIYKIFPESAIEIIKKYKELLLFDAIVGNNDRHFFNWGVIRNLKGKTNPKFSPIYDTARGLFWNYSESKINNIIEQNNVEKEIVKYDKNSKPKIGWDNVSNVNHRILIELLAENDRINLSYILNVISDKNLQLTENVINNEFKLLISPKRKKLILSFLRKRFKDISEILTILLHDKKIDK